MVQVRRAMAAASAARGAAAGVDGAASSDNDNDEGDGGPRDLEIDLDAHTVAASLAQLHEEKASLLGLMQVLLPAAALPARASTLRGALWLRVLLV